MPSGQAGLSQADRSHTGSATDSWRAVAASVITAAQAKAQAEKVILDR